MTPISSLAALPDKPLCADSRCDVLQPSQRRSRALRGTLLESRSLRVTLAMLALSTVLAIPSQAYADSRSGGRILLERPDDAEHSSARQSATPIEAVTLDASIDVQVRGLLADVTLVQRFRNTTDDWRHARYLFPMADGALLRGLRIKVGDRVIRGTVMETTAAAKTFESARRDGRVASIVSAERPNLFTTRIANVAPGETMDVTLELLLPVAVEDDRLRLTLPTTLTPRYVNELTPAPVAIQGTIVQPDLARGPRVSLSLHFPDDQRAPDVSSASHRLARDGTVFTLQAAADRDILLDWPLAEAGGLFKGEHAGARYVQLLLTPPPVENSPVPAPDTPRELVLVLDRSGSMAGGPIEAARAAIEAALDRLGPDDGFNIVAFDDRLDALFDVSRAATPAAIEQARRWVRGVDAEGGTEIEPALEFAIRHSRADRHTQIVFVTDGSIGYEEALLGRIASSLDGRRLFTVGIGTAPNRWFLERAATIGRGEALFITDDSAVERSITTLLDTLRAPVLTDLVVGVDGGSATFYPDPLPDLYAGRPVMVVAQLHGSVEAIVAHGLNGDARWSERWPVPAAHAERNGNPVGGIAAYWTQRRIEHLEDEQRVAADHERHRDEITALALEAGIASTYTSFVAVAERVSRPQGSDARSSDVANLMPASATMQSIVLPQGAIGLGTLTRWSTVSALLGLLMLAAARRLGRCA